MKKTAQDAANKIYKDQTLSSEDRAAALAGDPVPRRRQASGGLLDDKQLKSYISQGGWWLNNLAPAPRAANHENQVFLIALSLAVNLILAALIFRQGHGVAAPSSGDYRWKSVRRKIRRPHRINLA